MLCRTCPANLLEVTRNDAAVVGVFYVIRVCGIAVALTGIGLLAGRWLRASKPQRHAVMPVAVAGAVAFTALIAAYVARVLGMDSPNVFDRIAYYASAAVPVAVLAVLIQRRLARGAVAGLVVELSGPGPVVELREALSRALSDPSLTLGYWFQAEGRYVDRDGKPVELPGPDSGRRSTVVERDGQPVAVLIHDPALEHNAKLVDSVCAAAGLALENERLQAELRAASLADFKTEIASRAPYAAALIALATFALLFLMTGSVLIPLKALAMNTLSLGATFGALVWVFQDGHLSGLLGFTAFGAIEAWLPVIVFTFAFGLSMDYEVFLLSRIKEAHDETGNTNDAVANGLQRSGRIITSAAFLIMIVFLGFAAGQTLGIKQMGLALAIAVAVDATLVRCVLVPATMTLLGRANW